MPLVALRARAVLGRSTSRGMSSLANERAIEAARRHLPNSTGRLLEVGSGTGSNLTSLALAFRGWHIQPSDIDALLLPKIAAAAEQWSNVAAPVCLDAAAPADDWPVEPSFDLILAVNVCHYASPQATRGLVRHPALPLPNRTLATARRTRTDRLEPRLARRSFWVPIGSSARAACSAYTGRSCRRSLSQPITPNPSPLSPSPHRSANPEPEPNPNPKQGAGKHRSLPSRMFNVRCLPPLLRRGALAAERRPRAG